MSDWEDDPCCPICGGKDISWGYSAPPMQGSAECHNDGCEVLAVADTTAEAVRLFRAGEWTHRVVDYDENGHPEYEARTVNEGAE